MYFLAEVNKQVKVTRTYKVLAAVMVGVLVEMEAAQFSGWLIIISQNSSKSIEPEPSCNIRVCFIHCLINKQFL